MWKHSQPASFCGFTNVHDEKDADVKNLRPFFIFVRKDIKKGCMHARCTQPFSIIVNNRIRKQSLTFIQRGLLPILINIQLDKRILIYDKFDRRQIIV